ncbi:hypothetical protein EV193_11152 [Herbihabitans rhizosphaerae]|uniref:DUF5302 domain-containing protein n=1 Tax=Herbihabitans rhizosphaerae TaxID=1872711 RepID=A0A4Q7KEJ3_9PSEU|nr:DUF5302 domain-containing protein [Herbihabitans rhizosphaerae]RZS32675.1 hypothetical protein EV193_11152 [Herbihabitans rhizosphaerae]
MAEEPKSDDTTTTDQQDDVKRRFREALERKQANAQAGASHRDADSKVHNAHGPVAGKREFRRKSG